jgi:hypothetical protein
MNTMVRKTFYITPRQDALLKRLAQLRGVSEAEIIRQAIDREIERLEPTAAQGELSEIENFSKLAKEHRLEGINGEPYKWNRQELYDERENRWLRHHDEKKEE